MKITKQIMNKLTVCAIIWLLTSVSIVSLIGTAGASDPNWNTIDSLPVIIDEPGNYRIASDLTADSEDAISIQANDVVIDGQNHTINADTDYYGILAQDVSNITISNLNIIGGTDGLHISSSNFTTIQNFNSTDTSSDGIAIYDCSNLTISGCTPIKSVDSGIDIGDSSDFQIIACNCSFNGNTGLYVDTASNFQIASCNVANITNYSGMYLYNCNESSVSDSVIQNIYDYEDLEYPDNGQAIAVDACNNFTVTSTQIENCSKGIEIVAYKGDVSSNCIVSSCVFTNISYSAVYVCGDRYSGCQNVTVTDCAFFNQTGMAVMAVQVDNLQITGNLVENLSQCGIAVVCTNSTITHNIFRNNGYGLDSEMGNSAIAFSCSNSTITDNIFNQNHDAIYWMVISIDRMSVNTSVCNADIQRNVFQNNNNTFLVGYDFPTSYDYQKMYFSNNLVNDTAYFNPESLQMSGENAPINNAIFNFNSTISLGKRTQSIGPFIGGNYWAHPNGTGPSQTGTDANRDGFIDTPLELLGNATVGTAYDYHPYSDNFDVHQWIDITLPAEIYSPGNYRIVNSWTGSNPGLQINANDVTVDGQNCAVSTAFSVGIPAITAAGSNIEIGNLTAQGSFAGIMIQASNFTLQNIAMDNTTIGVYMLNSENFTITNTTVTNTRAGIAAANSANFAITDCAVTNVTGYGSSIGYGAAFSSCENFVFENVNCNNNQSGIALYLELSNHFLINNCNLTNGEDGLLGYSNANFAIENCNMNFNGWATELFYSGNINFQNNQMSNNTQAVHIGKSNNVTFTGNTFSYNGLSEYAGTYCGGLEAADSNVTITNNLFESNYDAYMWSALRENVTSNQYVYNNTFHNNVYTFFFNNQFPSNCTAQKLYFYNNFVNDSAYVDPVCFNATYSGDYLPFNGTIFNFNTTQQAGTRIYGNGPNIGGNYWAYTNGSGPSQTGADANKDGFIDTSFELFKNATIGTAYDYLPLSTSYEASTPSGSSSGSSSSNTSPTTRPTPTPTPTQTPNTIEATKNDNTKTTLAISGNITASQYSNVTLTTNQAASTTTLSFTVTGQSGTTGYANITIPKNQIPYGTNIVVYIDGAPAASQGYTEDANNYYVWYSTSFSTHQITIAFANQENTPTESPQPPYLIIAAAIAAIAVIIAIVVVYKRRSK